MVELDELLAEQHDRYGQYRMINPPKKTTSKMIDINERKNLTCAKCGTTLSVKYKRTVNGKEQCFCNKCIVTV